MGHNGIPHREDSFFLKKTEPKRLIFNMTTALSKQVAILSGQIFDPKNRFVEGRILSTSEGIIDALTIYVWPAGVSNDDKLNYLAYMTAFGRSDDESSTKWASWMYSYIVLCFEPMAELIRRQGGREYTFEKLPMHSIAAVSKLRDRALSFTGSGEDKEYATDLASLEFPSKFPNLSRTRESFPEDLAGCGIVTAVYGFCALLIFMAGKKITERNSITITERRPQNLIDSYKIHESASYFLTGEGKMETTCHQMCNQAWVTYAAARKAIITDVAAFASGTTLPQRVVYTVSKLLENVGMQPAYYIHRFLQAFPECVNYACIRPALSVYAASIREVAKADSRIQPYYKVINGDLTRVFHRNGILVLSACAISFEKNTAPSMRNFILGEGATMAVNMFDAEASAAGNRTLSEFANVIEEDDKPE